MSRTSSPFAAPPPRKAPKVKRDSDQERAEKNYVRARDNGCVADWLFRHHMTDSPVCQGPLDVDHHRLKTDWGKTWRPLLIAYLERVER
jgi:hypothetical protein